MDKPLTMLIDKVKFSYAIRWYEISLLRVFINKKDRGQGLLAPAVIKFCEYADSKKLTIELTIMPDSGSDKDYERLRKAFNYELGFMPFEQGSTIYRNDLRREPKILIT